MTYNTISDIVNANAVDIVKGITDLKFFGKSYAFKYNNIDITGVFGGLFLFVNNNKDSVINPTEKNYIEIHLKSFCILETKI